MLLTDKDVLVRGLGVPTKNIIKEVAGIEARILSCLMESADMIHESADTVPPKIPVKTGKLRESFFKEAVWEEDEVKVDFGYKAPYAAIVHEMGAGFLGKTIKWTREGSGAKFLDASMKRNKKKIKTCLGFSANVDKQHKYSKFDNFVWNLLTD